MRQRMSNASQNCLYVFSALLHPGERETQASQQTMRWSIFVSLLVVPTVLALEVVTVCRNTYGTDFLIQVVPCSGVDAHEQASTTVGYLNQNGFISHNCRQGSIWSLSNAQLSSYAQKVSALKNVASCPFSTSTLLEVENTKFAITNDFLFWDNTEFQDGTARFCASLGFNATLTAVFYGPMPFGCVQASLRTVPRR